MSRSERSARSEKVPFRNTGGDRPRHQEGYRDRPYREREESRSHASNGRQPSYGQGRNNQHSRPPSSHSDHQSRMPKSPQHQSPPSHRTYTDKESFSDKCSRICSRRGILQLVEILLNLLVLICASTSASASAGFSSIGGFGSTYYYAMGYAMSGFQGDEVSQISQLDMEYSNMKMPTVYCAVGISVLMLSLTLAFLAATFMSHTAKNKKLLIAETVMNVTCAIIYIICISLYIHFIKKINSTETCKQRESLYNRRGYNSVACDLLGTEVAVCVLSLMLVVSYIASAVVVGLMLRSCWSESDGNGEVRNIQLHVTNDIPGSCILQFVEITAGLLVLICVVASYAVLMGYTSAAGFSTFSIDSAYSPFEGTELQQVREADMKYTQLRAPGVYGGVGFSLLLCALTVVFLMLGSKPLHSVSIKILFAEFIFDCLAFAGYIIAVGLYLYFIKHVNSTDICKTRERLYAGRGYTWMNCEVQGGDAAVALFGLIAGCLYLPSAIFCWLHIRKAREFKKNHQHCRYTPQPRSQNEYKTSRNDMPMAQMHPSTLV